MAELSFNTGYKLPELGLTPLFSDFLQSDCSLKTLPLTHNTDYFKSQEIFKTKKIKPKLCRVFIGERLLYLFYGRASYVVSEGEQPRRDDSYYPICFIINPHIVKMDTIFPFDSGGFKERYKSFIHKEMDIRKFALAPNFDYVKRFIKTFYTNNRNYICADCTYVGKEDFSLEEEAYINMLNNKGAVEFDSRGTAIEVISKHTIPINNKSIYAIILPSTLKRKYKLDKLESKYNIKIITYNTFGEAPESYNAVIKQFVHDYLEKNNFFAE